MRLSQPDSRQLAAIKSLCYSGLDSKSLRAAVTERLSRYLRAEQVTFASLDPDTGLLTHSVAHGCPGEQWEEFTERAYLRTPAADPGRIATGRRRVWRVEQLIPKENHANDPALQILQAYGWRYEVQVSLASGGKGWGHLVLDRRSQGEPFIDGEVRLLDLLVPHLTAGLRAAIARDTLAASPGSGVGVVVLSPEGGVEMANGVAERMLAGPVRLGKHDVFTAARVVAALVGRSLTESDPLLVPAITVVDPESRELYRLSAERVMGSDGRPRGMVLIEPAQPARRAEALAYLGLTEREREVTAAVLRGESTQRIAAGLRISEHTVRHHLRHIFAKVGVNSRRQLAAQLFGAIG